ncbi:hypothetical protein GF386_01410 [Candidatus Pacearchaeota archaeon]|nr:hypothetical protein [Candidatus Pacearchaeota archaeon]
MKKSVCLLLAVLFLALVFVSAEDPDQNFDASDVSTWYSSQQNINYVIENWDALQSLKDTWNIPDNSQQRTDFYNSLSVDQKGDFWHNKLDSQGKSVFLFDLSPEGRLSFWKATSPEDKVDVWQHLDSSDKENRNQLWSDLDKAERNKIWYRDVMPGEEEVLLLENSVRKELFESLETVEEKEEMLSQIASSWHSKDKLDRLEGINVDENEKIDFDLSGADLSKITFTRDKIFYGEIGDSAFMDSGIYNENLDKISFIQEGFIEQHHKNGVIARYNMGSVDREGIVLANNGRPIHVNGDNIDVSKAKMGEIELDGYLSEENGKECRKIVMREGAKIKIGDNWFEQFFHRNSKYDLYRPKDKNGNVIDEDAFVHVRQAGDSPSNYRSVVALTNVIASTPSGYVYTSRREEINFFYNLKDKPDYWILNELDLSKETPYIEIADTGEDIDVVMRSHNYIGFIAKEGADVNLLKMEGLGEYVSGPTKGLEEVGKYLHFRNGDFAVSIKSGETWISGNAQKAAVAVNNIQNRNDVKYPMTVERDENGYLLTYDPETGNYQEPELAHEFSVETSTTGSEGSFQLTEEKTGRVSYKSKIWEGDTASDVVSEVVPESSQQIARDAYSNRGTRSSRRGWRSFWGR